jgi:hypothetical protein
MEQKKRERNCQKNGLTFLYTCELKINRHFSGPFRLHPMAVATREKRSREDATTDGWFTGESSLTDSGFLSRFSSPDWLGGSRSCGMEASSAERVKSHSPTPLSSLSNVLRCTLNTSNVCAHSLPEVPSGACVSKRWRLESVSKVSFFFLLLLFLLFALMLAALLVLVCIPLCLIGVCLRLTVSAFPSLCCRLTLEQGASVLARDLSDLVYPSASQGRDEYMSKCSRTVLNCCEHVRQSLKKEDVALAHSQLEALTNTLADLLGTSLFKIDQLESATLKTFALAWTAFLRAAKLSRKMNLGEVQDTRHQLELIHFALSRHAIDLLAPVLSYLRKLLASL